MIHMRNQLEKEFKREEKKKVNDENLKKSKLGKGGLGRGPRKRMTIRTTKLEKEV